MTDRIRTAADAPWRMAGVGHMSARECMTCGRRTCVYVGGKVKKRGPFIVGWICGRCVEASKC